MAVSDHRRLRATALAALALGVLVACAQPAAPATTVPAATQPSPDTPAATQSAPVADQTPTTKATRVPESTATTETTSPSADADVLFVRAAAQENGAWRFDVTVAHPDTGWEDYADGWDVVLPDGTVLKARPDDPFTRLLLHPHETEQPFTRSQSGLVIPDGVTAITVRAHDLVDGFGGREVVVDLTAASGQDFEVVR